MPINLFDSVHGGSFRRTIFPKNVNSGHFIFTNDCNTNTNTNIDYLFVWDDASHALKIPHSVQKTIHIATEPMWMNRYTPNFLNQFDFHIGMINSSIEGVEDIYNTLPGLDSFIPLYSNKNLYSDCKNKSKLLSIVTSNKFISQSKEHKKRYEFCKKLKQHFGDRIDWYGKGVNYIENKLDGLKNYRFHICLENNYQKDMFTEKLADAFIANCYPIHGAHPSAQNFFPKNALQTINVDDFQGAVKIIEHAIANNFDKLYSEQLNIAKELVTNDYNLFQIITDFVEKIENNEIQQVGQPQRIIHDRILPIKDVARFDRSNKYKAISKILPMYHIWNIERSLMKKKRALRERS